MKFSRPEQRVLLCTARRELRDQTPTELRELLELDLDWDYLISTASTHGLLPLLHKHLKESAKDLLRCEILARLKRESVSNRQSVLFLTSKLLKVCQLFTENGIDVAIFKGPLLAELAYGEMSLRQAGDLDILISPKSFARAKELLESLGYEMTPHLTPAQQSSHLGCHCEIQFMRDDWFTVVDLHWGLTPRTFVFGLSGDEVMTRLVPIQFAGSQLKTFGSEDFLLYQAMHGTKHRWRRLEWIASLAELVRQLDSAAWQTVVERAQKAHGTRILALGLRLVEVFFDVYAPAEVLVAVDGDETMLRMSEKIGAQLFDPGKSRPDSTDTNLDNLKIMDRKRDAVLSGLRAIFVPTLSDWEALSLPAPLHSLYYAYRPLRLTGVYGTSLFRRLKHPKD